MALLSRCVALVALWLSVPLVTNGQQSLPGTAPWPDRGDPAATMVEGLHRFLDRELAASPDRRVERWQREIDREPNAEQRLEAKRQRLAAILGLGDPRVSPPRMEILTVASDPGPLVQHEQVQAHVVRWPVFDDVAAEGLLVEPSSPPRADVVVLPDADTAPEALLGLVPGLPPDAQIARLLAASGCRVLVPTLLNRDSTFSGYPHARQTNLSHREWIWRMAFEAGRQPIGFEIEIVRAGLDWLSREGEPRRPLGLVGFGEGGRVALYTAALDDRVRAAWIAGAFGSRENLWSEPIDRDLFGILNEFGDAEVAALIAGRSLLIEPCRGPEVAGPPPPERGRSDAAPGALRSPENTKHEFDRAVRLAGSASATLMLLPSDESRSWNQDDRARPVFLQALTGSSARSDPGPLRDVAAIPDANARMGRLVRALETHTQRRLRLSEFRRYDLWKSADARSPAAWEKTTAPLRERFHDTVLGRLDLPEIPPKVRSILIREDDQTRAFAVEITIAPDAVTSGVLLLPTDLQPDERRPVVVCQHGLEGRPEPIIDPTLKSPYHGFGDALARRGYIVYAPQNPYTGNDRFRQLQRKLHPLGLSLFSVIVAQHQATLSWLKTQPNVDPRRIAFYGLSYGGKTAMRVPAILPDYCLSICSADFNEWVVKCTNLDRPMSYLYTIEYDMYEWDLAGGFNYAEMAGLIAPRPFLVERGHDDGVAPDEWVGYEFAKVKRAYDRLGLGDRCGIAYFNGPHEIDGKASFQFLADHLNWPRGARPLR